jgi:hypothetical protein
VEYRELHSVVFCHSLAFRLFHQRARWGDGDVLSAVGCEMLTPAVLLVPLLAAFSALGLSSELAQMVLLFLCASGPIIHVIGTVRLVASGDPGRSDSARRSDLRARNDKRREPTRIRTSDRPNLVALSVWLHDNTIK